MPQWNNGNRLEKLCPSIFTGLFGRHVTGKYQRETLHMGYDISLPELSKMTISNSIFNYWKVIQVFGYQGIWNQIPQLRLKSG